MAAHAGAAVKSTGDGVMAVFAATASALRCATAIQGAVADHNRETGDGVALRVGMSVGDAVVDGGDLQGTAVVEAARLCAVAEPGTVLCSEAVRSVSANRSGCVFGEPRSVELKGLPVPVVVHEVVDGPSADRPDGRGLSFGVLGPLEVERDGLGPWRWVGRRSGWCWRCSSLAPAPSSRWMRWSTRCGANASPARPNGRSTPTSPDYYGPSNPGTSPAARRR